MIVLRFRNLMISSVLGCVRGYLTKMDLSTTFVMYVLKYSALYFRNVVHLVEYCIADGI